MGAGALWRKIVSGSGVNRTRLHDRYGVRVPAGRLVRNAPRSLASAVLRVGFGWLPERPWLSYDAVRVIDARLRPHSRVLEFGSGMSTLWFAERAAEVVSIESDPAWHARLVALLQRKGRTNVRYRLTRDLLAYAALAPEEIGDGFDLVLVDGEVRNICAEAAIRVLRPGGAVYLDNADRCTVGMTPETDTGMTPQARRRLLAFAEEQGASVEWFTDFLPGQLVAQTGLLVTLPPDRGTVGDRAGR